MNWDASRRVYLPGYGGPTPRRIIYLLLPLAGKNSSIHVVSNLKESNLKLIGNCLFHRLRNCSLLVGRMRVIGTYTVPTT